METLNYLIDHRQVIIITGDFNNKSTRLLLMSHGVFGLIRQNECSI